MTTRLPQLKPASWGSLSKWVCIGVDEALPTADSAIGHRVLANRHPEAAPNVTVIRRFSRAESPAIPPVLFWHLSDLASSSDLSPQSGWANADIDRVAVTHD